jgi:hypothetical protein
MKKNFLMIVFAGLFVAAVLCAYNEGGNGGDASNPISGNKITVKVENGDSYNDRIDTVKVEMDDYDFVMYSASYANGQFTLELSASVNSKYLDSIPKFPAGVTVRNANVRIGKAGLIAYKSGRRVGHFFHGVEDEWEGELLYANGAVSITGSCADDDGDTETYGINAKKGWNIAYEKITETLQVFTTNTPSGAKWCYYSYDDIASEDK